jgi:serine/threonine protein kinase
MSSSTVIACSINILGETLRKHLDKKEPINEETALKWTLQVALALLHLYNKGHIHRALKPSNIFIDEDANAKLGGFAYVSDNR